MSLRVLLVDDHEIVRRGIADIIGTAADLEVVGEAAGVEEALARAPQVNADVAVLDVRMPDGNGIELCRDLKSQLPDLRCLMLTSYADDDALFDAIMAGASGFVLKQVLGLDLLAAIRTVGAGGSLLDPRTTAALMNRIRREREEHNPLNALTEQERAVFDLIGEGLTNRQIGEKLFLAEKTIKNYVSHLLNKLGMQRRTQAAVLAAELRSRKQGG
ncbi:response regulator [Actinophytocola algeriensis]|uniref:DNA-binding NarL/FixJ family response regulator n=1 Tax=Actinophytocola algeriensis TaxID=1768010 RepID=A0A7W7QCD3_9PSEU|nr:response regulator transcription factor [Actinophytocola algeriensis]MBB4911046.1 DNA-binding NarL/FixJ family response regulator [Actinophytocola algeriensis]MBE1474039.1 DNA-binding NarL/FixJ family response regulator [Actinophytocola algeriensis]